MPEPKGVICYVRAPQPACGSQKPVAWLLRFFYESPLRVKRFFG